jgi:cell wall-associated NlpC family hydrolase
MRPIGRATLVAVLWGLIMAIFATPSLAAKHFVYHGNSINERIDFYSKVVRYDRKTLKMLDHSDLARQAPRATTKEVRSLKRQLDYAKRNLHFARRDYREWEKDQQAVGIATTGGTMAPTSYSGVVGIAEQYLGVPYVYGGSTPSGFDCSGFTSYVYAQVGVSLPHNAAAQYGYGVPVSLDALQPGDLVFFYGLGHVGIYVGGGQIIHAPSTGGVVEIISMSYMPPDGARRIL